MDIKLNYQSEIICCSDDLEDLFLDQSDPVRIFDALANLDFNNFLRDENSWSRLLNKIIQ